MARNKKCSWEQTTEETGRRETLFAYSWSLPSLVLILLIRKLPDLLYRIYLHDQYEHLSLE